MSKILKGKENMSLDTLSKLEDALDISLIYDEQVASPSMVAEEVFAWYHSIVPYLLDWGLSLCFANVGLIAEQGLKI